MFRRSVLAGIFIGLGGLGFLAVGGGIPGAIIFTFGLLCVVYSGSLLFTGRAGYIGTKLRWKDLGIILFGNVIGAWIVSLIARGSGVGVDYAAALVSGRLDISLFQVFMKGLGCGLIIDMVVWFWLEKNTIIPILFGVPLFILTGMLHSITEPGYIFTAGILSWRILLYWILVVFGNFIGCNIRRILIIPSKNR